MFRPLASVFRPNVQGVGNSKGVSESCWRVGQGHETKTTSSGSSQSLHLYTEVHIHTYMHTYMLTYFLYVIFT